MKQVIAYQTADGVVHPTHDEAKRYAQRRYDDAMTAARHAITKRLDFCSSAASLAFTVTVWLEAHFGYVAELQKLQADALDFHPLPSDD